ncbi:MAG: zinc ribbon domain-containing protein [Candidatus Hodarchaeota archaeon]
MVNLKLVFGIAICGFAVFGLIVSVPMIIISGLFIYDHPVDISEPTAYAVIVNPNVYVPDLGNIHLVNIKFKAESLSAKDLFIGLAPKSQVLKFVENVSHIEITSINSEDQDSSFGDWRDDFEVVFVPGTQALNLSDPPFWIEESTGSSTVLPWYPEEGQYILVIMNTDASQGMELQYRQGIKFEIFRIIGIIFLVISLFGVSIGALLIYAGYSARKRTQVIERPSVPISPPSSSESSVYGAPSSKVHEPTLFCPTCGYHLPAVIQDSAFCPKCGGKLT